MYRAVTRQIEVTVEPNFMPERSSAENSRYFWSYTIVITNSGDETVQLRTRHWIITDASGKRQEVRGEGVVGEQPVLAPGERFEYTSGVPLTTASGFIDRTLSDDQRKRRKLRDRRADILARQPRGQAGVELRHACASYPRMRGIHYATASRPNH
jgi:ApaG protein